MKKLLLTVFLPLILCTGTFAAHIIGGELRYEYVGQGTLPNTKIYKVILLLVKGDATGPNVADFAPSYVVGIFNNDNNQIVPGPELRQMWRMMQDNPPGILPVPINASPCLTNQPTLSYTYATYSFNIQLADNSNGYTIAHQTCCRQANMQNVQQTGATYTCIIPGENQLLSLFEVDNCPKFNLPVTVICFEAPFTLDFSATDADGDSLVYSFCNAYNGGRSTNSGFDDADPPPYLSVDYINGFTANAPLGNLATINPSTGIISGIAPASGNYVVCVCVQAYRNGRLLTTHRKDLLVRVSPCIPTQAVPDPGFLTCDGFNIQFNHNSTGANNVFWDFGDPSTDADTSLMDNPVYVYPDTGIFYVKFFINKGQNCTDSQTIRMAIYPGFFPGFTAEAPFCAGQPIQFNDTTVTNYGVVSAWQWNFGNTATLADTSDIRLPQYTYPAAGTYQTTFIVSNSKGCVDTVYKEIVVNPLPSLSVSPPVTYCGLDSTQISATGTGTFTWFPATNITGGNTNTPTVFPSIPTTYFATIDVAGCKKTDSIRVTPLFDLANDIISDPPSICEGDTITLTGSSNRNSGVNWQWITGSVFSPNNRITRAAPAASTNYTLQTRWGNNCIATKTINVPVIPLAIPQAGPDAIICAGQTTTVLNASGGISYQWSPATGLSNAFIANPVASPSVSTNYVVSVGVDGCSRRRTDTVNVLVKQKPVITVTNDTIICVVDGLQMNSNGAGTASWTPNYNINNTSILNPFVRPLITTTYKVRITDQFGCYTDDSVRVNVKPKTEVEAGPDTTICRSDRIKLSAAGDALKYQWLPATGLSSDTSLNPFATPLETITYQLIGNIGTCSDTSLVTIKVVPYPAAFAGTDSTVCIGFNAQLFATGGSRYLWQPTIYLNDPNIADPVVIEPQMTTNYTVTVTDTLGCPKPATDIVKVVVIPKLNVWAGRDTSIVSGEPLMLLGNGAVNYSWTWFPANLSGWLSGNTVRNPIATPEDNITYILEGSDNNGCRGVDSVNVLVFRVTEDMYVPTAFTPNGDKLNDIIKPILLGMKSLNYFRVFNRFGELVFETSEKEKGWDGIFKGKPQDHGTFVWMAQGVTYKNKTITRKGYVVLIR